MMTRRFGERFWHSAGGILPALWLAGWVGTVWAQAPDAPVPNVSATSPDVATLPRDLSPWGMFDNADVIVKTVMVGLALASLVTSLVGLAKGIEVVMARRRLRKDLQVLVQARSLTDAASQLDGRHAVAGLIETALAEVEASADAADKEGIKERVALRLSRVEAYAGRRMMRGTGVLATIGATAPFVGLFGTVWGIMNSFIGISKAHTTNLAVVAPGIAEALLATALGLAAAIPAVVIYNVFSRQIGSYRIQLGNASAAVLRVVSRDLDRAGGQSTSAQRSLSLSAAE